MNVEHLTEIHRYVAAARAGREPRMVARVPSGWYCSGSGSSARLYAPVAGSRRPDADTLRAAPRAQFLSDMWRAWRCAS